MGRKVPFLRREYRVLVDLCRHGRRCFWPSPMHRIVSMPKLRRTLISSPLIAVSFIVGALCSGAFAGFIGMTVATRGQRPYDERRAH